MRNYLPILIFILLNLLWSPTTAQQYLFDAQLLTTDDGLANLMTTALFQDRKGYLWIGNNRGLNRYDGYAFHLYTKEKNGLRNSNNINNIKAIQEDEKGNLWLFYMEDIHSSPSGRPISGIDIFDIGQETGLSFEEYLGHKTPFLPENVTLPKIIDPQNRLWISTLSGELFLLEEGVFRKIFEQKGAVFKYISIDSNDNIWLGWDKQVVCLNKSGDVLEKVRLPHNVYGIWLDNDGTVWLAVNKSEHEDEPGKFSLFYKRKGRAKLEPFNLKKDALTEKSKKVIETYIHRDEKGYWYSNFNGALNLYDSHGEWIGNFVSQLDGISNFGCMNNFECNGNIWWGSSIGVLKTNVKKNPFQLIHKKQEHFSDCRGITEDEYGNIYFINSKAYRWNPNQKLLKNLTPHTERTFTYFLKYKDGKIWTGTYNGENLGVQIDLDLMEETGFSGLNGARPYTLLESNDANKYLVGTDRGIEYVDFNLEKVLPFDPYRPDDPREDLLKKSTVYHLHKNRSGIWAATSNGVFLLSEKEGVLKHYTTPSDLPYVGEIYFIYEDNAGLFWLATSEGGLVQWKPSLDEKLPSTLKQFTTEEGLSNNATYAIYEDGHNLLWISSDKGIMCMDKKTYEVKTFLMKDGLPHNEFNLTSHYQAKDGTLYFGGLGGLIAFHPDEIAKSFIAQTPLQITDYHLLEDGAEQMVDQTGLLKETKEIKLKPSDQIFELRFALMDYDKKEHHRYAYQIEGYHDHWQFIEDNYIRINSLPYGDYLLKVKGQNINKGWSENELAIKIKALTPFYLQWWFIGSLLLIGFGIVVTIVRRKEQILQKDKERLEAEVQKRTITIQEQAEELKELDKAKTRFFSNITHEFRTPLTLIIGPLEQVISEQVLSSILRRRIDGVLKNARHLLTLINQMLDISKIESGSMKMEVTRGDIIAYTQELTNRFEPLAHKKEQRLTFIAHKENWETHFDKEKWDKIIYNLLSNAIKFTKSKGGIQLNLLKLEKGNQEYIRLDVQDTGVGIEKEQLSQIFNRFHQVNKSSTHTPDGTGIGLALVKELVEMQGGEIMVSSEVGKGTTFEIHLPVLEASEVPFLVYEPSSEIVLPTRSEAIVSTAISTTESNNLPKLELLIIEDNEEIREYIRYCIDVSKYNITEAVDGAEGIEKAKALIPDLIISDVMMPKKNGFEVAETIRNDIITSHIPLILLTAKASLESRLKGLQRGADAYLTKPFSPQELILRIQKLIDIRQLLQKRYENDIEPAKHETYQKEDEFIINLREYILQNIDSTNLNGDSIGKHFGVSRANLYRKLKALTNQSISEFVRSVRLKKAMELIQDGKLNVSEIAYSAGFSSLSNFSRSFKKAYGKTPSDFRN